MNPKKIGLAAVSVLAAGAIIGRPICVREKILLPAGGILLYRLPSWGDAISFVYE